MKPTTVRATKREPIPVDVRRRLWVAAAGRCEFRGCGEPVDEDFLTKARVYVGEVAHVVADSPGGARGDVARSSKLAHDERNLMLTCFDCHNRIDRGGQKNPYSEVDLLAMKTEHEARIRLIYRTTGVKRTLPILMTFPIGAHVPVIDPEDINYAIVENSAYKRFPSGRHIGIDRSDFDLVDGQAQFWPSAERALEQLYQQRVRPELTARNGPTHLTIAAFAPMPLLMKLGVLIGDKMDASVLDLPGERWLWDKNAPQGPRYLFEVPGRLPREVAIEVCVTSRVSSVAAPADGVTLRFAAEQPNRAIIRTEAHVLEFRKRFNEFLVAVTRAGARALHLYPAAPLSACVEVGRVLLTKTVEEVHVYDWQAPDWNSALRLR